MLEFSIIPLDKGESFSDSLVPLMDIIDRSGLPYRLNPMGTVLEGEYDSVMNVVRDCFMALQNTSRRISLSIKIDYRQDEKSRLDSKISIIEKKLGRSLQK